MKSKSRSVVSDFSQTHGLYNPWNSLGQNTGMGSHFLLQGIIPNPGIELKSSESPALQADPFSTEPPGKPNIEGKKFNF